MKKLFFKFLLGGVVLINPVFSQQCDCYEGEEYCDNGEAYAEEDMCCESEFRDYCKYRGRYEYIPSYTLQFERATSWPGHRQDSFVDALTR